jgi:hypothetical protein
MPIECRSDRYANIVREMIRHENDLVNHRLTWLCVIQGLLFTALGATLDKANHEYIQIGLSLFGIAVSISSYIGLKLANYAIIKLKTDFEKKISLLFWPRYYWL